MAFKCLPIFGKSEREGASVATETRVSFLNVNILVFSKIRNESSHVAQLHASDFWFRDFRFWHCVQSSCQTVYLSS